MSRAENEKFINEFYGVGDSSVGAVIAEMGLDALTDEAVEKLAKFQRENAEIADEICKTCECYNPDSGGDGYNGECPDCADKTYERELYEGLTPLGKLAVDKGMDSTSADIDNDDKDLPETVAYLENIIDELSPEQKDLLNAHKTKVSAPSAGM